jgi:hypothetical protein
MNIPLTGGFSLGGSRARTEWQGNCSKHLIVHGGVATGRRWSALRSANGSNIGIAFTSREVIGHLGIKFLDCLLLRAFTAASTSSSTATFGLSSTSASTASSSWRCLCSSGGLRLVLLCLSVYR